MTKKEAKKSRCCEAARLAAKTMAASLLRKPARAVIRPAGANIARSPVSLRSTVAPCSQPRNPLRRASRAFASSGHLFRFLFGCPKRKNSRKHDAVKGCRRKVAASAKREPYRPIKLPAAKATSASFTPSGSFTFTVSGYSAASSRKAWQAGAQAARSSGVLPPK